MPNDFLKELSDLFIKYNVRMESHDIYDGEDNYQGQDHYLVIGSDPYYQQTIEEIFEELSKNINQ